MESVVPGILEDVCGTAFVKVFEAEKKDKAIESLERLLNQNEQAMGLFYLHPDDDSGISVPAVAMLRVTIAIRTQHYPLLCKARSGRLHSLFSNKLGWLSGNLYSRVATQDWNDADGGKDELASIIRKVLSSNGVQWVQRSWLKEASRKGVDLSALDPSAVMTTLKKLAPAPPRDKAVERVSAIAAEVIGAAKDTVLAKMRRKLQLDADATPAELSDATVAVEAAINEAMASIATKLPQRLTNDQDFKSYCRDA